MHLKQLTIVFLAICIPALVLAGAVEPRPVEVNLNPDGSGNAQGSMSTARFSDNDVEYIGCGVRIWSQPDGSYMHWGFCQAKAADGTQSICNTEDPEMLDVMKATGDYSFITFEWDADGNCTYLGFSTQSFYIPEHINKNKPNKGPKNN